MYEDGTVNAISIHVPRVEDDNHLGAGARL